MWLTEFSVGFFIFSQQFSQQFGRLDREIGRKVHENLGKIYEHLGKIHEHLGKIHEQLGTIDENLGKFKFIFGRPGLRAFAFSLTNHSA